VQVVLCTACYINIMLENYFTRARRRLPPQWYRVESTPYGYCQFSKMPHPAGRLGSRASVSANYQMFSVGMGRGDLQGGDNSTGFISDSVSRWLTLSVSSWQYLKYSVHEDQYEYCITTIAPHSRTHQWPTNKQFCLAMKFNVFNYLQQSRR